LVGHDLHESDTRGIINADVDELPPDAVVTVNRTRISASDAMSHRADPAELFDVNVDEFARVLTLIAPNWFGRLQSTQFIQSQPTQTRLTVAGETPVSAAICLPVQRCRRKASTAAQVAGAVWLGNERGLDERSRNPPTPSAWKRSTHLATVFGVVLN
jgi:hypothetical protein